MASVGLVPELYVSDYPRSLHFYTQICGFVLLYHRAEDAFAYLVREDTRLMIEQIGSSRTWITGPLDYPFGRGVNFQIAVTDATALHDVLVSEYYPISLPLEDKWYRKDKTYVGKRQFMVKDPDGYLLRFAEDIGDKTAHELKQRETP